MLSSFMEEHQLPSEFSSIAEQYYAPLADLFSEQAIKRNTPYFVGVNGCQGSGKSTLVDFIKDYLATHKGLYVVTMSLDDFYLSRERRQTLAEQVHPLLKTRGVPGTHDIANLANVLNKFKHKKTGFLIPQFDKSTDDLRPKQEWLNVTSSPDIVMLEGWIWGVSAQTEKQLISPVNELEVNYDTEGIWRRYVNEQIKNNYQPLYQYMDYWVMLRAPSFDCVYQWRLEQENKLALKNKLTENKVMTPEFVERFILYFERLTIESLTNVPNFSDYIFELFEDRTIKQVKTK